MAVSALDDADDSAEQPLLQRKIVLVDYYEVASFQTGLGDLSLGFALEQKDVILGPSTSERPLEHRYDSPALP